MVVHCHSFRGDTGHHAEPQRGWGREARPRGLPIAAAQEMEQDVEGSGVGALGDKPRGRPAEKQDGWVGRQ